MRTTLHLSAYGQSRAGIEADLYAQIGRYLDETDQESIKERTSIEISVDRDYSTVSTGGGIVTVVADSFNANATVKIIK